MVIDPVNPIRLRIKGIISQLISNDHEDEQTGSDPQRQPPDIEQRIAETAADIPKSGQKIVNQHAFTP
jgi:hypothetical protein